MLEHEDRRKRCITPFIDGSGGTYPIASLRKPTKA
jgi:hypothetical protein